MFLKLQCSGAVCTAQASGRWQIDNAAAIAEALAAPLAGDGSPAGAMRSLTMDAAAVEEMDLTGAWLLFGWLQGLQQQSVQVTWQGRVPGSIQFIQKTMQGAAAPLQDTGVDPAAPLRSLGRWAVDSLQSTRYALAFFGHFCTILGSALLRPRRLRPPSLVRHIYETGVQAIPIVALIAFLISVIIAYMGAQQLRKFGAEIFVVDLVTVGVLRELGVLLTAIIVAGRSGSAFAAEIGVMKLNDEVDALRAIGTDTMEVLVLPRVLGLMVALPLLTIVADAVGLAGGGLLSYYLLDMSPLQYVSRMQEAIAPTTFWVGIVKAPVFALLIAGVGTLRGMQVRNSSRELGRLTTVAVVQSIFLVIFADAIFAVIFMELDL